MNRNRLLSQTSVTLLGTESQCEHSDSLHAMLDGRVAGLSSVCDSQTHRAEPSTNWFRRLNRLAGQLWGTNDPKYQQYVIQKLDEAQSEIVVGYWGTIPLPDLLAIKKARPKIKVVLLLLCYPLALTRSGILRQDFFMRRAIHFLDGIVFPSELMEGYVRGRTFQRHFPPSVVIPPCWPKSFQADHELHPTAPDPNLIYVGRTDLSSRTIHVADDLRQLMSGLLETGIHLHHLYSPEMDDGHPGRKAFPPQPMRRLIDLMGDYDGSLIAYNTKACSRDDRFWLTIPDRLVTSVAAGVPIAIPRQGYAAAKSYLKNYPVIQFDSPQDLAEQLADRPKIAALREAAWNARPNYAAAAHGPAFAQFLEQLLC